MITDREHFSNVNRGCHASVARRLSWVAACLLLTVAPGASADERLCISVFRYGGAASGWIRGTPAGVGVHAGANGSYDSIARHIARANEVWAQADIEWVWDDGAIEDITDAFGAGDGDVTGLPASDPVDSNPDDFPSSREVEDYIEDIGTSEDLAAILTATQDAECFPVVFVNGLGSFGLALGGMGLIVPALAGSPGGPSSVGRMVLVGSRAFPKPELPVGTWRRESLVSTLAHEFGHALCLDLPSWTPAPGPPAVGGGAWSAAGNRHPPYLTVPTGGFGGGPYDPYSPGGGIPSLGGFAFTPLVALPPPFSDGSPVAVPAGNPDTFTVGGAAPVNLTHCDVMWFTSEQRGHDPAVAVAEGLSLRQIAVSNYCAPFLRDEFSPSMSVAPGGPTALPHNDLLWAPAFPVAAVPPPVAMGLGALGLDAISYGADFEAGRYAYKFSVDAATAGRPGTAVNTEFSKAPPEAHGDEFAGPIPGGGNVHILDEGQLGFAIGDDLDGLIHDSPFAVDNDDGADPGTDPDRDGVLDAAERVYFSVSPGGAPDPADVLVVVGAPGAGAPLVYAARAALGLMPGDDIDAVCVFEGGDEPLEFNPDDGDRILFSLTRASPTTAGVPDAADILGPGPIVITTAAELGLFGANDDEVNALKCYKAPKPKQLPAVSATGLIAAILLLSFTAVFTIQRSVRRSSPSPSR